MYTMNTLFRQIAIAILAIAAISCGDEESGLVDEAYQGDPLVSIKGTLTIAAPETINEPISFAVAWLAPLEVDVQTASADGSGNDASAGNAPIPPNPDGLDPNGPTVDEIPDEAAEQGEDTLNSEMVDDGSDVVDDNITEEQQEDMYSDIGYGCGRFEGDQYGDTPCDGTLAPPLSTVCREMPHMDLWSMQGVEYKAESLVEFTLPIYDLPPESARNVDPYMVPGGWWTEGVIVAFLDRDGDQKFKKGTPDRTEDVLLSLSASVHEENMFVGWVLFIEGTPSQEMQDWYDVGELKQGYNLVYQTAVEAKVLDFSEPLPLVPIDNTIIGPELVELQCAEVEYRHVFNGPLPETTNFLCMSSEMTIGTGMPTENGEGISLLEEMFLSWSMPEGDASNPCIVHVQSGAVCYTDESQIPLGWEEGICDPVTNVSSETSGANG